MSENASVTYAGGTNSSRGTAYSRSSTVLVEHLPGADLLLDHVEAGLFEVHRRSSAERRDGGEKL